MWIQVTSSNSSASLHPKFLLWVKYFITSPTKQKFEWKSCLALQILKRLKEGSIIYCMIFIPKNGLTEMVGRQSARVRLLNLLNTMQIANE